MPIRIEKSIYQLEKLNSVGQPGDEKESNAILVYWEVREEDRQPRQWKAKEHRERKRAGKVLDPCLAGAQDKDRPISKEDHRPMSELRGKVRKVRKKKLI